MTQPPGDEQDKVDFDGPMLMPKSSTPLPVYSGGPVFSGGPLAQLTKIRHNGETCKLPVGSVYIVSETGELLSQTKSPAGSTWVNIETGAVVVPDQRSLLGRSWGFRFLWRKLGSILTRFRSVIAG